MSLKILGPMEACHIEAPTQINQDYVPDFRAAVTWGPLELS